MSDPLEPIRRLERRLREELRSTGFEVVEFSLSTGSGDAITIVLVPMPNPPAPQGDDPEFDAIIEGERARELSERAEREREELIEMRDHLRDPRKGFLD